MENCINSNNRSPKLDKRKKMDGWEKAKSKYSLMGKELDLVKIIYLYII